MIEFDKVIKTYKNTRALDEFSWRVGPGEIHGLLGHNGSGKTTSFMIANRMTRYNSGQVKIFDKPVKELSKAEVQKIGLLTERLRIYKELTIRESLDFFCDMFSIKNKKAKIDEMANRFGFEKYIDKRIEHLSTGMYKKVVIAITFINDPYIVFLDEPFSGLDPVIVKQISSILNAYREEKGTTIVLSSHNLHEIEELADTITIMKAGKEVVSDKIGDLFGKYDINKSYSISYLLGNKELSETVDDEVALTNKLIALKEQGAFVLKIKEVRVKLTDIYNKIYV